MSFENKNGKFINFQYVQSILVFTLVNFNCFPFFAIAGVEYVMEPLRTAPNQVRSTLLEDTAQSEPRSSETDLEIFRMKGIAEMELFTMKGKNIAENQQSEDLDLEVGFTYKFFPVKLIKMMINIVLNYFN